MTLENPNIVRLVLPYPPSANRVWRTRVVKGIAMTYVSHEAKAYKDAIGWIARQAGIRKPITGRVEVTYTLFPKRPLDWKKRAEKDPLGWDDTVSCLDLDNANKVLMDALKGVVFEDDRWVRRIEAERAEPDGEARLEVTIRKIVCESPQASLV